MTPANRSFVAISVALPLSCIGGAYAWLAVDHHTPALWNVVVHESGVYSLRDTVFYFSHFLREIPIDIVMGLFLAAGFRDALGVDERARPRRALAVACGLAAAAIAAWAFVAASSEHGAASARLDLFQYRTRDDTSAYGSHWHYHLASTLWFGIAAPLAAAAIAAIAGRGPQRHRDGRALMFTAWGLFVALCVVFGISALAFTSVRYTGHQARELVTHAPITLPLVFAALALTAGTARASRADRRVAALFRVFGASPVRTLLVVAVPVLLAVTTMRGDVMTEGQSEGGLAAMVAAHVFEHTLDYVFTVLIALAATVWSRR